MSKTYRKNQQFRPKKNGRVFTKEDPWTKKKRDKQSSDANKSDLYKEPFDDESI